MNDLDFLISMSEQKPCKRPEPSIANFVSSSRIMPPGTPFPGPVDLTLTPYAIEWMENMSPYSHVQHQAILKAAQIAATFAIENIIGYWMREMPTAIMYLSATQALLEKWGTKRLEPMIDSIGMREKIIEHAESQFGRKSRRTGDKTFSKQFVGGFLEMASAQSPASQRSDSIRVMIRDEIDGAPTQLTTGEGNWLKTSAARTKFWGDRKKITDLSTPTLFELSNIYPEYLDGDRREYMVPCPHCGKEQSLFWKPEEGSHGLRGDFKAGILQDAYYLCEHCREAIFDTAKYKMFNAGRWIPMATSWSPTFRSYYINSLYSPPRTVSWKDYYTEWQKAKDIPDDMRGFTNLYGGMPYKETGKRPKIEKIIKNRGGYQSGEVPNDVLWITAGADVQRGKEYYEGMSDEDFDRELLRLEKMGKDPWKEGLPRIELELLGHGHGYRTYSIEYRVFYGNTADPYAGAWEKLRDWLNETQLIFTRLDGSRVACSRVLIDSGDGERTATVYNFCEDFPGILPCKGDQILKKKLAEKGDEITAKTYMRYDTTKLSETQRLVTVSTSYYKNLVYKSLEIDRLEEGEQHPRFPDFPRDYPDYYFQMLTAEEKHADGSFHAGSRRNESLDCFDDITEVLTDKGWILFKYLKKSEKLATYNMDSCEIEYQKPIAYIEKDHDGDMVSLKGRRMDILVTPNHRMVTVKKRLEYQADGSRKWNLNPPPQITLAKDLTIHHQIVVAGDWIGDSSEYMTIPEWKSVQGITYWPEVKVNKADLADFIGWFVSEGHSYIANKNRKDRSNARRVSITQKKPDMVKKIRELLSRLPWGFHEHIDRGETSVFTSTSGQLYDFVQECGKGAHNKRVPQWIKDSSQEVISRFLDSAILGDGWMQTNPGQRDHRTYATTSKKLADDIQELMIKNGTAANIREVQPNFVYHDSSINVAAGKLFTTPRLQYHVSECKYKKASLDSSSGGKRHYLGKNVHYTGKVYCATVPNGTLLLRRNGKSFFAGNCRVYALCASDLLIDQQVFDLRGKAIAKGMPRKNAESFYTSRSVVEGYRAAREVERARAAQVK